MEITRARYEYGAVPPRRQRKRRFGVLLAIALVLVSSGYGVLAYRKPVGAFGGEQRALSASAAEQIAIEWPPNGQAAIGDKDDGLLASYSDAEKQQPIASITKVITALVVLDKQPLGIGEQGQTYTIDQADVASYRSYVAQLGSVMPVSIGQQLTTYQALQGMMLPSANNVASSLAVWVFGSLDAYIAAANQYLATHGLQQTVVVDASGFLPGSMSTPSDLIRIGKMALAHPVLAEIINQREAVIPGTGEIRNTNFFLQRNENVLGIKTGTTDEAGYCLLFAIKHGPKDDKVLVGAVLGQPSWTELYARVESLRDQTLRYYKTIEIAPAGTVVGHYKTAWGQESEVVTLDPIVVYAWGGSAQALSISMDEIEAPAKAGTVVGSASAQSDSAAQTKLILRSPLSPPSLSWKLLNYW